MSITSEIRSSLIAFVLLLSACQGPWSYWPEDPENYQGFMVYAHVVSGRSLSGVCLEKMLKLDEAYVPAFSFFDSASLTIEGRFSGKDTAVALSQNASRPNCFSGPEDLLAEPGFRYTLQGSVRWDSAGESRTTFFSSHTYIPRSFRITHALAPAPAVMENALDDPRVLMALQKEFGDTLLQLANDSAAAVAFVMQNYQRLSNALRSILTPYSSGDSVFYMDPPNDLLSHYFIPEYSTDVGGVLIAQTFDTLQAATGTTTFDSFFGQTIDTLDRADAGDRHRLEFYRNSAFADITNAMDSMAIVNAYFKLGRTDFLFYATTSEYADYMETAIYNIDDSRIKTKYNVEGAGGIFAGMLVDTFSVYARSLPGAISYPYMRARTLFCRDTSWSVPECRSHLPYFCSTDDYQSPECWAPAVKVALDSAFAWDALLPDTVPAAERAGVRYDGEKRWCIANDFPDSLATCRSEYNLAQESAVETSSMVDLWNWCKDRNWPLTQHPQCGTALVSWTRINKMKSSILEREIDKWCNAHPEDPQCKLRD